jgi:hypothetical protein
MSVTELNSLLLNNVVDLRFVRRRQVNYKSPIRRMICTKSFELLNSNNGLISLGYRKPVGAPDYNPETEGLVTVWDIIMQDYRNIPAETVTINKIIPANDQFWTYFNEQLYTMSAQQKMQFMSS